MTVGKLHIGLREVLLTALTAAAVGAGTALALYLNSDTTQAAIKADVEAKLSQVLKREFLVGRVEYRLPLTIVVRDVAIASWDSVGRGTLLEVPEVRASVNPLLSVLSRRIMVGSVRLARAQVRLEQRPDGTWNFQDLFKSDTTKPKGKKNFPPVSVPNIVLEDVGLVVRMPKTTERIDSINFSAGLKMGGEKLFLSIKDLRLQERSRGIEVTRARGLLAMVGDSLKLKNFKLGLGRSGLELDLWLDSKSKAFELAKGSLSLDLADVGRWTGAPAGSYLGNVELDASASGSLEAPQGRVAVSSGSCLAAGMAIDQIEARVAVDGRVVRLQSLSVTSGQGQVTGQGHLNWKELSYQLQVAIERLNVGALMARRSPGLKSDINAELACQGSGFDLKAMKAGATLQMRKSSFNNIPLDKLDAKVSVADGAVTIEQFQLASGQAALNIKGEVYQKAISIELETDEIELAQFGPLVGLKELGGKLRFNGLISGETKNPDIIGTFRLKDAAMAGASCEFFDGNLSMKSLATSPVGDGKFTAAGITVGKTSIERVAMLTELRGLDWGGFSVVVTKDSLTEANLVGRVEIKKKDVTLVISKLFYASGSQMAANSQPIEIQMAGPNITLKPTNLILGRGKLGLAGSYTGDKRFTAWVKAQGIDSRRLVELAGLNKTVHGMVNLTLNAQGSLAEPQFRLWLSVDNVRYEQFTADRFSLDLGYANKRLDLTKLSVTRFGEQSEVTASVPVALGLGQDPRKLIDAPISGEVILRDIGTWAFFPMAELLSVWEGRVDVNVQIAGTPLKPNLSGEMTVNDGKMVLRPFGMYLHDVQARAHFNADSIVIDNVSALTENNGTVQVKRGEIILVKFMPTTMYFLVATERSPIRNIPFIEANVNSRIIIGGTVNSPKITGDVVVNSALITLPFAPAEEPPPPEGEVKPLDMSLSITGNQGIWLRNADADIELKIENLNVRLSQNLLFLSGRLEPIRGTYHPAFMYRSFDITGGQLMFTNSALINPDLNLSAYTQLTDSARTEVFLTVGGNALQPKLSFTSKPSMPEQDILTLLSAGVRLDEMSNIDLKEQAINRGTQYLSNKLSGVAQKTGFMDVVKLKGMYTDQEKGAQITMGKYVARNVYVSYSQNAGIGTNLANEFQAEYRFGSRNALFAKKDEKGKYNLGVRMKFKY